MPVLIRNPESGDQKAAQRALQLAAERDYEIRETESAGDAITIARDAAADDASLIVACGGDGTLNEVVRGVIDANALSEVRIGLVPAGTGNDFAGTIGVRDVEHAFEVLDRGRERPLDLGFAVDPDDGEGPDSPRPFVNSCLCGLTAEASARTSSEIKQRVGVFAYVLETLRHSREFDAPRLRVEVAGGDETRWTGEAAMLLACNGRDIPGPDTDQANVEDGLLDLAIVEQAPALDYLREGALQRLFGDDASQMIRRKGTQISIDADEPRQFSLDGEFLEARRLDLRCEPGVLRFVVGESYDPSPEA
ncbi:diacylglycerol/lipid kinase family protein [Haloferacaceae archaeon DSL9]